MKGIKLPFSSTRKNEMTKKNINEITAKELADYIVSKCIKDKIYISNVRLQQILICIYHRYSQKGEKIFRYDEINWNKAIPQCTEVYMDYCMYGAMPIMFQIEPPEIEPEEKDIDKIIEEKRELAIWDMADEINEIKSYYIEKGDNHEI